MGASFRHNPILKARDTKLPAAGKAKTLSLVACVPKLLATLNAMLGNRTP